MERKEAIEIIKKNWPDSGFTTLREALETLIPELKESEDEKIRKWLICYFKDVCDNVSEKEKKCVLAWLEKQGEKKPIKEHDICDTCDEKSSCVIPCPVKLIDQKPADKEYTFKAIPRLLEMIQPTDRVKSYCQKLIDNLEQEGYCTDAKIVRGCLKQMNGEKVAMATMDEQKPADKVEPKFHKGEWVVSPNGVCWHIDAVWNGRYEVTSNTGQCGDWPLSTNIYHPWTIKDAKDGDILFLSTTASSDIFIFKEIGEDNMVTCYCAYDSEDGFREGKYHFIGSKNNKYHPATQVQRDALMKAMTNAGYEWDAEKKELKKIEQKPAWSEEDEKEVVILEAYICSNDWSKSHVDRALGIVYKLVNKVKSLRPQKQWKPSDEQIDVVKHIIDHVPLSARDKSTLYDLYLDLKRLTNYE